MQRVQRHRTRCEVGNRTPRSSNGFSLIELMVTLAIVSGLALVAVAGFRQNEKRGQTRRWVASVQGLLTQARNRAIDEQTPVRVEIEATSVALTAWNPVSHSWEPFRARSMNYRQDALLMRDDVVCILGLSPGVQTPAQAVTVAPPTDCLAILQRLRFEPDGTFSDPNNTFSDVPNAGVTLWIGDRSLPAEPRYSIVQVFPGGLIRTFEDLS